MQHSLCYTFKARSTVKVWSSCQILRVYLLATIYAFESKCINLSLFFIAGDDKRSRICRRLVGLFVIGKDFQYCIKAFLVLLPTTLQGRNVIVEDSSPQSHCFNDKPNAHQDLFTVQHTAASGQQGLCNVITLDLKCYSCSIRSIGKMRMARSLGAKRAEWCRP